ncbi:MAG: penicillin-binding protein 2 [Bacillota bacterium]|nr:penicillin-binding protein 2 [Bacillota bacterium]REJ38113.1 MAG: penicillin-binding protein 2 [Bacillota bacterium]
MTGEDPERREQRERRSRAAIAVLAVVTLVMVLRLGYMQILHGDRYALYAQQQRVRPLDLIPARGDILDAGGRVLATSRPAYTASLVYTGRPLPDEARRLLKEILGVTDDEIDGALAELQLYPFQPARLRVDLTPQQHTLLEENRMRLPGVVVEALPLRVYPEGSLASHVLGYVRQLGQWTVQGASGLERTFDQPPEYLADSGVVGLAGISGRLLVEVDVAGRLVGVRESEPPRQGDTLRLTLDARLQAAAEQALREHMAALREARTGNCPCPAPAAALVAIDVRTGGIKAMASVPDFDPNVFSLQPFLRRGTDRRQEVDQVIQGYIEEGVFLNRAIQSRYPPGSVFKVVTALAGLENGLGSLALTCPGYLSYGRRVYRDNAAHGHVDLEEALARSCNTYFWTMGLRLGTERMGQTASALGLDGTSGLRDVAGEVASRFPHGTDPLNTAIGQGEHLYTPIQIASLMATVANHGVRHRPYLVDAVLDPDGSVIYQAEPEVLGRVELPEAVWDRLIDSMVGVTTCRSGYCGTAYSRFADAPYTVAGKTGTAERAGYSSAWNYAWFASFAPAEDPEIAVAVIVEAGGGGSSGAGPVARRFYDVYFGLQPSPLDDGRDWSAAERTSAGTGHTSEEGG